MEASIITPELTITHTDIIDIVVPTPQGNKHINNSNGQVETIKKGKVQILYKKAGSANPCVAEISISNGIVYVENKVINIVTELNHNA